MRRRSWPLRGLAAAGLTLALAAACSSRAPIPAPQHPLAATPREALSSGTEAAPIPGHRALRYERRTLANGLTLLVVEGAPNGIVSVCFVSRALSTLDPRASAPVSTVAAASLMRATRVGSEVHDDLLERAGFSPTLELLPEGLVVIDRMLADELPRFVEALEQTLRSPVVEPGALSLMLRSRIERFSAHRYTPDGVIDDRLPAMLYAEGDRRALGLEARVDILSAIQPERIEARQAELIDPARATMIVVGDVAAAEVEALVQARFASWPEREPPPPAPPPRLRTEGPRGLGIVQSLVRSYVKLVERAPPLMHEDHAAFLVIEQLLGAMFGARLNLVLREREGVSYGFHARYAASGDAGELALVTALDPSVTASALRAIIGELSRMRGEGEGVLPDELARAKTRAREQLRAELDSSQGVALHFGRAALCEAEPESVEARVARIDGLTASDVAAAARRWIRPDRAPFVVVGSAGVVESVRGAGLGEVERMAAPQRSRR